MFLEKSEIKNICELCWCFSELCEKKKVSLKGRRGINENVEFYTKLIKKIGSEEAFTN